MGGGLIFIAIMRLTHVPWAEWIVVGDEAPLASVLSRRYVYIQIRVLFGDYKDTGGRRSGRNEKAEGEEDFIARLEALVI